MGGTLVPTVPGSEAALLDSLIDTDNAVRRHLRLPGSVILLGERLSGVPGGFSAARRLSEATGARLAWVPRRAGDRGAVEAGVLPGLLPGGRSVDDPVARADLRSVWGTELPDTAGRDAADMLGPGPALGALIVGGVELADLPDPRAARAAVASAGFVVSLELRESEVTELADVVFPVAAVAEKPGTFLDWEGRARPFDTALRTTGVLPDQRVLHAVAAEMGIDLGLPDAAAARAEIGRIGPWAGARAVGPAEPAGAIAAPECGEAVLASWRMLLDNGRLQDGEPHLAATARTPVARLSVETAAEIGVEIGDRVTISTDRGSITAPAVFDDLPPRVIWVPLNSPGSTVHETLVAAPGAVVKIAKAAAQ